MKNRVMIMLCLLTMIVSVISLISSYSLKKEIRNMENKKSAYEVALENGFIGNEKEWLFSLVGTEEDKAETNDVQSLDVGDVETEEKENERILPNDENETVNTFTSALYGTSLYAFQSPYEGIYLPTKFRVHLNEFVYASSYGIKPGYVDVQLFNEMLLDEKIKNKTIIFQDGIYIFSDTLKLGSNVYLQGGANTVFQLDKNSLSTTLICMENIDQVMISNITLQGNHTTKPNQKGNRVGISINSCRSINIENVNFVGWELYGLYAKNMSSYGDAEDGKFYKQLQLLNCRFYINYIGSYFDYRCEYSQVLNCVFGENYIGSINCGGNNMYVSCMWNANDFGFILNNEGSNPAHGSCNSCTFNHNSTAIQINQCVNGWTFNGCQIFYGKVELNESKGVIFNGNVWGSCMLYSNHSDAENQNLISNTYFQTDSTKILANNDGSTYIYCCLPDALPSMDKTTTNQIEDTQWKKLMHTTNGVHPGASNCYFGNCSSPINKGEMISNLYVVIHGAKKGSIIKDFNVWVVNGENNKVIEKIVNHETMEVVYSKDLKKYVLNVSIDKEYDYPVYFIAQAIRENSVGIAYSYDNSSNYFLDTNEVEIGDVIKPNSNVCAEFAVYQK